MKIKCTMIILAMSILDILIAINIKENIIMAIGFFVVSATGILILYYILIAPIRTMRNKLDEVEAENRRVENMRREFVANVSHELKTPLTSISGFIETLQNGAIEDPEIRMRFINIVAIETTRLKRLISDLLQLSDIENEAQNSESYFNVKNSVEGTIEVLEPIASERKIELKCKIGNEIKIKGSEDKFKQMIMNLIENGIKYNRDGGYVYVDASETTNEIIINIKDSGIGIANDDINRIAERFYRVDKSRSKKVGGTGLGLSIVKHAATLFNGELTISSELGKGSTFTITIKK